MAVTPAGTPYVESSDNVADYPGVSLALANHIDDTAGKVLQVVSVTKVDAFTTTSASFTDITGLSASITPSAVSSTILVLYKVAANLRIADMAAFLQLLRGATAIGGGTAVGSRPSAMSGFYTGVALATTDLTGNFIDSPASVASQTYKIQTRVVGGTVGINTTMDDSDGAGRNRLSSTITLMEIGA